ncbi:MAG: CBS domain-containing protein [Candidatus Aenigmatarchaeota archaeon]|nr:MAG: CBS domain-containing protein [Candidatus Aenigmarchaeota archaeon]
MNRNVTLIHPDKSVRYAGQILKAVDIGCLVVVDREKISGILTERDIVQKVVSNGLDINNTCVRDIMSDNVITMDRKKTVEEAVDLMEKRGIKKIPIVENGKLIGIVTMTDLLAFLRKIEK